MEVYKPFMKYWEYEQQGIKIVKKISKDAPQWAKDEHEAWVKRKKEEEDNFLSI